MPNRPFELVAGNLAGCADPAVAIAASRAGAVGLLNLEHTRTEEARDAIARLAAHGRGTLAVTLDDRPDARALIASLPPAIRVIVLATSSAGGWPALVGAAGEGGRRVLCECTSVEQARQAIAAGAAGIVAKGGEAGGHVGEETTFVLVQRLVSLGVPVWAAGGISLHTAAACQVAGCAGVVLDAAFALARESRLPAPLRAAIERMEGDEAVCVGGTIGDLFRLYRRAGARLVDELQRREQELSDSPADDAVVEWRRELRGRIDMADPAGVWPIGQDASFAAPLARLHKTVPRILEAFRAAVADHVRIARDLRPLAPGAPLARAHRTTYPILQGPMTRVSDTPGFADAVAAGGALPFLALALMRGPQVRRLLEQTRERLGSRAWGVGILGFVPPELRQEQLEVIHAVKPAFALIAGGRPDQAASLERDGIPTYLHVPSPGLLRSFVESGARRFVFEGRECGGHVGPRTSFVLWTAMVDVLVEMVRGGVPAEELHVAFAGGIHDATSAAMVAALSAPLAAAGVRVGVLIGTAYLFTREAVDSRAIVEGFQREALDCTRTVLFETAPGHAIRCAETPYFQAFRELKRQLLTEGRRGDEVKDTLESQNLGRLRVASKGILRDTAADGSPRYLEVDPDQQRLDGMYMLGQVAALRRDVLRIEELHRDVSAGGMALFDAIAVPEPAAAADAPPPCDVAIIGVGCVLPGAPDVRTFWSNVLNKVDAITEVPKDRFDADAYFDRDVKARDRIVSKWGGFLADVPFDPVKYGIPPSALPSIDSLQLLALEVVDQAMQDAGLADRPFPRERTSVIFGASGGLGDLGMQYGVRSMLPSLVGDVPPDVLERLPEWTEDSFAGILLNVAAGRVANRFNFGGVNYTVDAACASSLAAVQLAAAELQRGTSDVVVVGGIDTVQTPFGYMCFSTSQALSPRGRCRTFDAGADGIAISEGVVALVVKRLADAERDGDRIYAVIKAVAGSSDGRGKGLTAPRPEGQMRALRRAYAQARIAASTIGLIEAHGTGTVAGDAAEVAALDEVFRADGAAPESCAIGSVKSMIGHTKASAGVAGLLKAALALHHRVLPPTLHVEQPNARLREGGSPFYLNAEPAPWTGGGTPRRAGVSSFGFGGTNFHAVLEEYAGDFLDRREPGCDAWPAELFTWGGADAASLAAALAPIKASLELAVPPSLRSLAAAVCRGSRAAADAPVRLAVVASSHDDLRTKLALAEDALAGGRTALADARGVYVGSGARPGKLAFLFPGQGSQTPGMLRDLAVQFAEMRDALHAFDRALEGRLPRRVSSYIYPPSAYSAAERDAQARALTDTAIAQPALGAVESGLLKLLASMGVKPDMVAGHSYGEYVALHAAGVIDETTLAHLSELRGRAIKEAVGDAPGTMAAASAGADAVRAALGDRSGVWLANFNAPQQTIIAGLAPAVEAAVAVLGRAGISAKPIPVACAFHTPLMSGARARLDEALAPVRFGAPRVPVFSNALASAYPHDPARIGGILSEHLVSPVRFVDEVRAMHDAGARVFLEVGPRSVLTALARRIVSDAEAIAVDAGDRHGVVQLLQALAQLTACGVPLDPSRLFEGRSVEALDPTLRPAQTRAAAWVVNGAGARQVSAPRTARPAAATIPVPSRAEPAAVIAPAAPAAPVTTLSAGPPTMDERVPPTPGADAVMLQFQQMMSRFLETQAAVMSAYLGAVSGQPLPAPIPAAMPLPAIAPPPPAAALPALPAAMPPAAEPVPAVTAAAPAPPAVAPPDAAADFTARLVAVAAERTGYAPEMLDLDLSIEADLGIDSIKRVEILSAVRRACSEADQQKLQSAMDALTRLKTLREIARAMTAAVGSAAAPAPAAATSPVLQPAAAAPAPVGTAGEQLLEIVSERTGYPLDMLGLDLNIEADLGIDSIKRVEILASFRRQRSAEDQARLQAVMDRLTGLKTLRELSRVLEETIAGTPVPAAQARAEAPAAAAAPAPPTEASTAPQSQALTRVVFAVADAPPLVHALSARGSIGLTLVTDDGGGVAAAVCARLRAAGDRAVLLRQRGGPIELLPGELFADWANAAEADRALARLRQTGSVAAVLHLAPLAAAPSLDALTMGQWRHRVHADLRQLHLLVRSSSADLRAAGRARGAAILAATALGGDFGQGGRIDRPTHGGVVGYMRTAAIEFPEVRTRIVDFDAAEPVERAADRIVAELDSDGPLEIGYSGSTRVTLAASLAPLEPAGAVPITSQSVVLLTGGARGITAELAIELAHRFRPTLVLAGLSPVPAEVEDRATADLDGSVLKSALAAQLARGQATVRPVEVERAYQRVVRGREIRRTLATCQAAGARVEYRQADVRDEASLASLLDDVYKRHRRIDVLVHGAGIIEDKLIEDKTPESFDRVVHTKADSLFTLVRRLRADAPAVLVLMSSVTAAFGNRGQADYGAANGVYNAMAQMLSARRGGRAVAINWGPWDKLGMASEEVRRQFLARGITPIDPAAGVQAVLAELASGAQADAVVVLGDGPWARGADAERAVEMLA